MFSAAEARTLMNGSDIIGYSLRPESLLAAAYTQVDESGSGYHILLSVYMAGTEERKDLC